MPFATRRVRAHAGWRNICRTRGTTRRTSTFGTFNDFERLVAKKRLPIIERYVVDDRYRVRPRMALPNLFGSRAFYRLGRAVS